MKTEIEYVGKSLTRLLHFWLFRRCYAKLQTNIRYLPLKSMVSGSYNLDLPLKSMVSGSYNLDFIPKFQTSRLKAVFLAQQGI